MNTKKDGMQYHNNMHNPDYFLQQRGSADSSIKALKGKLNQLRNIIENMNELFYTYDLALRITFVNRKAKDILGYEPKKVVGRYVWEFVPERFRHQFLETMHQRMAAGTSGNYEMTITHHNGSERIFKINVSPLLEEGKVVGEMTLAEDITHSKHTLRALQESNYSLQLIQEELSATNEQLAAREEALQIQLEETRIAKENLAEAHRQLSEIIDFLPDATFAVNTKGEVTVWNQAMEKMTGIKSENIINKDKLEYALPFYGSKRPMLVDLIIHPEIAAFDTYPMLKREGISLLAQRWSPALNGGTFIFGKASPLFDSLGNLVGAIESIRDVTAQVLNDQALIKSEELHRTILNSIEEGYFEVDKTGNFTFCNRALCEKVEVLPEELLGKSYREVMDDANADIVFAVFHQVFLTKEPYRNFSWTVRSKTGQEFFVESTILPIISDSEVIGFRGMVRDYTERRKAEEALEQSRAELNIQVDYLTALIDNMNEMFITFNHEGQITLANNQSIVVTGYDKLPGVLLIDLVPPEYHDQVKNAILACLLKGEKGSHEIPLVTRTRGQRLFKMNIAPIFKNSIITGGMALAEDITEARESQQSLAYLSSHDFLTGLNNRHYFEKQMDNLENAQDWQAGLIVCDVDGLKLINDTFGHMAGDQLLIEAARIIRACAQDKCVVARIGGDEFAILMPWATTEQLKGLIQLMREEIADYNKAKPEILLSISMGFALRTSSSISMREIFREADNNMYREKLHIGQSKRSAIVRTLARALGARDFITEGHGERIQDMVVNMGQYLELSERSLKDLKLLAQFHDIGKVGISDTILFKKGPLTPNEHKEMQRHCELGHRIALSSHDLSPIADWILKHHEWWNGQGYPLNLKHEEIPIECRILAIADAYDAMTNDRPYRKAIPHIKALQEIERCAGSQFDPDLTRVFLKLYRNRP